MGTSGASSVLHPPLQSKPRQRGLMQLPTERQGSRDDDVPPDSQSSLREALELLDWATAAPRPLALAAAC